jgi:hypothetical protein
MTLDITNLTAGSFCGGAAGQVTASGKTARDAVPEGKA